MSEALDTRAVVERYFHAWVGKRLDEAMSCLAEDLVFLGPSAHYASAAEFKPALERFAAMTKRAKILELVVQEERAAMLYDCELPSGTIPIASFFRVKAGKIRWYQTVFERGGPQPPSGR